NVGDTGVADLLDKAEQSAKGAFEKSRLTAIRLLLIERQFATDVRAASAAARDLAKKYADAKEVDVTIAALHLLAAGAGQYALPDLLAAIDSPGAELRNGALDAALLIKDPEAAVALADKLRAKATP